LAFLDDVIHICTKEISGSFLFVQPIQSSPTVSPLLRFRPLLHFRSPSPSYARLRPSFHFLSPVRLYRHSFLSTRSSLATAFLPFLASVSHAAPPRLRSSNLHIYGAFGVRDASPPPRSYAATPPATFFQVASVAMLAEGVRIGSELDWNRIRKIKSTVCYELQVRHEFLPFFLILLLYPATRARRAVAKLYIHSYKHNLIALRCLNSYFLAVNAVDVLDK
jgi:hypothetical protein